MTKTNIHSLSSLLIEKKGRIFTVLCCLLLWQPVFSLEREYLVRMAEAQWISTGEKKHQCELTQVIPFYGEGKFIHKSGHKVVFNLFSDNPVMDDARVIVQSEPPSWRHDDTVFEIARFDFERGHNPLTVKNPYASRMFQQVENGMSPVVLYRDLADGRDIIAVMLSPVNFRKALAEYRECEKTLMDFDLDEIKNLKLYFATNKDIITERSKRDLRNVLRYLTMDPDIMQIKVDAHADARGRRRFNDKLSQRRSEAVSKYLLAIGAKKEMLYLVNHGERNPSHSNKNATGRSKNRRADVQLLTTPPPTEQEQKVIEDAEKMLRRRLLTERSIFNKKASDKKELLKKEQEIEAAEAQTEPAPEADSLSETASVDLPPEAESVSDYEDEEPPTPNFINFDHLVDKNNLISHPK